MMNTHDMSTHDLLEMASLDAMGLLDPEERDAFERAFRAATPPVQAQIRREQLRFSSMDELLPRVDPPLGLRARVIAAVRGAMETVAGRRDADAPALRFPSGVSRFWRVGAIGAMAAALVLGYFSVSFMYATRALEDAKTSIANNDQLHSEFGRKFTSQFMNASTQFVSFIPAADAQDVQGAQARLMFDPKKKQATLYVQDLPAAPGEYEVVVVDAKGNTTSAVITFSAGTAGINEKTISDIDLENKQLLIRLQGSGKAILKSQGS
jgi:hypothetical protein